MMITSLATSQIPAYIRKLLGRWLTPSLVAAAVTLWIAMSEIDRLVANFVGADGRNGRIASISGIGAEPDRTYTSWSSLNQFELDQLEWLAALYLRLDFVFALVYGFLLWRLAGKARGFRIVVVVVVAADVAEGQLILADISSISTGHDLEDVGLLETVTLIKWLSLLVFALTCLLLPKQRGAIARGLARLSGVIWFHRVSAATVGIIAALALLPIPGVSDQMPDSQRMWAESTAGITYFFINSVIVLLAALGLLVVARLRSSLAWKIWFHMDPPTDPPSRVLWLVAPVLLATGLTVLAIIDGASAARTGLVQFRLFVGLPALLLVVSLWISQKAPPEPLTPHKYSRRRALDMWQGGELLTVALISVAGMALVRSFVGPWAMMNLPGTYPLVEMMPEEWRGRVFGFLILGVMLGVGIFGLRAFMIWISPNLLLSDVRSEPGSVALGLRLVFLALSVASILLLLFWPGVTGSLGVSATAVLGIGSWAILVGLIIVWAQNRMPLEVFQKIGYRANPFLTLVAAALVVGQIFGGNTSMHLPRKVAALPPAERHDLRQEFGNWLAGSASCDFEVGNTAKKARPMLLLAAEGGGIRAADWTTRVIEVLAASDCGKQAVLLSSGVSGGSVGLVLATRYAPRTGNAPTTPVEASTKIAGQEGLAASVGGTIIRDSIGGATGLLFPPFDNGDSGWHDRAALMEQAWEKAADSEKHLLAGPFTSSDRGAAGAIMLNSTVTRSGCRLIFSQVQLPASGAFTKLPPACVSRPGTPVSIDFFDTLDMEKGKQDEKQHVFCNTGISWLTAAVLSARFPVISPAGRLEYQGQTKEGAAQAPRCDEQQAYQAIDGGYAEGSGLGTLTDVWGELREIVVEHNSSVDSGNAKAPGAEKSYVVPIFVYVRNSPGSDIAAAVPEPISEIVVPLVSSKANQAQSEAEAWLQRLELSADVCPQPSLESSCMKASGRITEILKSGRTVVAAPDSSPSVDPPLGWTLSLLSREVLSAALKKEKSECGDEASLCTLLNLLALAHR